MQKLSLNRTQKQCVSGTWNRDWKITKRQIRSDRLFYYGASETVETVSL